MRKEKKGAWSGYWADDPPGGTTSLDQLLAIAAQPGDVIKDDHRSQVKTVPVGNLRVVAKQPRDKNRRRWIRVLTLVRDSEVKHTLRSLSALRQAGVETPTPIAAVEKRRWGMVVDSWLFYVYRRGRPCGREEFPLVVEALCALQRAGFRHEDPHIANFLYDGDKVFVIDCKGKRRLGRFSDYNDFLLLEQKTEGAPDIARQLRIDTSTPVFRAVRAYQRYRSVRHRWKRRLRRRSRSARDLGGT